jgi:Family of unknown function (DUF5689)
MKMRILKPLAFAVLTAASLASCINSDDYNAPANQCVEPALTVNKTVAAVVAASTTAMQEYTADDVIEAYVNSSDERGNFFKIVYLQTLPAEGTPVGFSINIDKTTLFGEGFYPGRKVYIKLKGLMYAKTDNALELGADYQGAVGRIAESQYANYIMPSCSEVGEDQLVRQMTIAEAKNNANLNTLIELTDVQFADDFVGGTYYDDADTANTAGGATNRTITDADGGELVFRTSSYANFSGDIIPEGSGTIRGVLTKYGSTFQFVARSRDDIQLNNDRIIDVIVPGEPSESAQGGTAIVYTSSLNEPWTSYADGAQSFPAYVNDNSVGTRYWEVSAYQGNQYIEMTSYGGSGNPGVAASAEIFIPVNFDAASTFSFDKEIRYMAGEALKVYYVTDINYTPGNTYDVSTFTDITSQFTGLTYPANGQSQNTFTTAGTYSIPSGLTGNGYFVFQYNGSSTVTTTIQIDNVTIAP